MERAWREWGAGVWRTGLTAKGICDPFKQSSDHCGRTPAPPVSTSLEDEHLLLAEGSPLVPALRSRVARADETSQDALKTAAGRSKRDFSMPSDSQLTEQVGREQ